MYGVTDGKAVGTYIEHKFMQSLSTQFRLDTGNSAKGIDLPSLNVDLKTTSVRQPQSSCPFKSAGQKIHGLGYSLLVFVYEKREDHKKRTARLKFHHVIFVEKERTADHQMPRGLLQILDNDGNEDDLVAFMQDKLLPVDEIEMRRMARELLRRRPVLGYLTVSNALQWRLQYQRVISCAGTVDGVWRVYGGVQTKSD